MKISLLMLVYNREQFCSRAIQCGLAQRDIEFEFIIIDNGSTDNSSMIIDDFAKKDKRIKVVHKERGNIGSGRNAALDLATGNYVAFVDDDDYFAADFLKYLYELAENQNADIAVCGSNKEENGSISPNHIYCYDELYVMNAKEATENFLWRKLYNAAMPTKLIKRTMFDEISFSESGMYDDIATTYKFFANAKRVAAQGIPKYTFYRHPGNNSSAATKYHMLNPAQLYEYITAFKERTEYIKQRLPELTALSRYSEWSYMLSMIEKINRFNLTECAKIAEQMKREINNNRDEFINGGYLLDFEKGWVEKYLC